MGRDIHMYICRDGKPSERILDDGFRNSEWFDNISNHGWQTEYDHLPIKYGISPMADVQVQSKREKEDDGYCYYFDFLYFKVGDFKKWFRKYRPDKTAGWVTTYDKWRIENNKFFPDNCDLSVTMLKDVRIEDQHFIEYVNPYDPSAYLLNLLNEKNVSDNADITYFFDN